MDRMKWFHLSIFQSKLQWSYLLSGCITPLLIKTKKEDILEKYIIHFNEQRGPNIRLSVKINNGFAESFLQTTSTYIENFFKSFPCSNELTINKNNFIANFPTNSIFYGLHTASQNNLGPPLDRIVHGVQHNFSIIILKVFGQGIFDDELVNSFFIYAILKYF